ncbi:DUF1819 family protein [Lacticaseibacillus zhaodongensis]|uniref:DUF1819 family protein n=1 Tax=Lacticaseibacillus zhaodongensis TaxID=2668065 RepID=UPI0018AF92A7|nr:DUF1819 family protein [Lacticaseibacillus zhaodongensis]
MEKYKAGIDKNAFWLNELIAVAQMRDSGQEWADVQQAVVDDNQLLISSRQRAKQIYGVLNRRLESLPDKLRSLLLTSSMDDQKIINLVAIMNTELLIKDFILIRFRDELIVGDAKIEPYEIQAFFDHLQATNDVVASWTDQTIHRLGSTIRNYLRMAGLAVADGNDLVVQRPIVGYELEQALRNNGYGAYVNALTGM